MSPDLGSLKKTTKATKTILNYKFFFWFKKFKFEFIVLGAILFGLFIRLKLIRLNPFWLDEAGSANLINNQLTNLLTPTLNTGGNIAYIYILKFWSLLFNDSEVALRSLSIIFSLASILLIYKVTTYWFNKKAGSLAALFLSINYFSIFYAIQARPYSLVIFFSLLSFYYFSKLIKKSNFTYLLLYFLFTLIGLYLHPWFSLLLLTQIVYSLTLLKFKRNDLIFSQILLLISFFPWLVTIFTYGANNLSSFIPEISLKVFWQSLDKFFYPIAWVYVSVFFIAFLLIFFKLKIDSEKTFLIFQKKIWDKIKDNYLLILNYFFLPLIFASLVSLWKPFYLPGRYDAIVLPAIIMLFSVVWSKLKKVILIPLLCLLIIISLIVMNNDAKKYSSYENSDKIATQKLLEELKSGDIIIFTGLSGPTFEYYLPRLNNEQKNYNLIYFPPEMERNKIYQDYQKIIANPFENKEEVSELINYIKQIKEPNTTIWAILSLKNPDSLLIYESFNQEFKLIKEIDVSKNSSPMHYQLMVGFK